MTTRASKVRGIAAVALVFAFSGAALAQDKHATGSEFLDALVNGKPHAAIRYRFEEVEQKPFAKDAIAHTLRIRAGYTTGEFRGFSFLLEGEYLTDLFAERFNDTVNGKTDRPIVADPDATEINQAVLRYRGIPDTFLAVGRERIVLDNERFVGAVGFRQNEQTFDAATIVNTSIKDLELRYDYVASVQRIFGEDNRQGDWNTDNHFFHVAFGRYAFAKAAGYGYLLDIDDDRTLRSQIYGLRLTGEHPYMGVKFGYALEYAHQSDYENNPRNFNLDYYLIEPRLQAGWASAWLGYESLEGNGTSAFQTPLATLHKFNGFADKFLTTPANGLVDRYAGISFRLGDVVGFNGVTLQGIYHDYNTERGDADLGSEFNVELSGLVFKRYRLTFKYAHYVADGFATDTNKMWMFVDVNF